MFTTEPVKILNEIEEFLGISKFFGPDHFDFSGRKGFPCFKLDEESRSKCMSEHKARDHPVLNEKSLKYLHNYYKPIIDKFQDQTELTVNLSWFIIKSYIINYQLSK